MTLTVPPVMTNVWRYGALSSAGLLNSIPNASTGTFLASFQDGFPDITMTPEGAGGTPSPGGDINGIFNFITSIIVWVNAGGHFPYNASMSAAIGGYPVGAILELNSGTSTVISTVNGNTNNPNTNMTGWAPHGGLLMSTLVQVNAAQNTANSAVSAAATAQNTANTALGTANTANTNANTATANANTAIASAATANSNATNALANAATAQSIANNASAAAARANSKQHTWAAPGLGITATFGTTPWMQGLSTGSTVINPNSSGCYLVVITGLFWASVAGAEVTLTLRYGTGAGPSYGGGVVGSAASSQSEILSVPAGGGNPQPFTFTAFLSGLSVGASFWIDLEGQASSSTNVSVQCQSLIAVEVA